MADERTEEQDQTNNSSSKRQYSGLSARTKRRHRNAIKTELRGKLRINYESNDSSNNSSTNPSFINEHHNNCITEDYTDDFDSEKITFPCNISCTSKIETADFKDTDITKSLISWSQEHNITHSALDGLLKILKPLHPFLPKDSRTLLHTPRYINVVDCGGGSYIYFGLLAHIIERASCGLIQQNYPIIDRKMRQMNIDLLLSVSLNIDGLPVHSSTNKSFWPILCVLDQSINTNPFIVGLYYGETKPQEVNNYLKPFVGECIYLEKNGITLNDQKYAFRVSCIVADAPARAFLKCIKSHNSLYGCEKCTQEGIYIGRTTWQYKSNLNLRTDHAFYSEQYEDHQLTKTVLSNLEIGLVTQVPLDYMHLVCLGVVKKLIRVWIEKGPKKCKLRALKVTQISERLLQISKTNYPTEFSRRPRPIQLFKYWKATELRSFLLYLGPVVLSNILTKKLYEHFLTLHCSIYMYIMW